MDKRRLACGPMQDYRNRDYVLSQLDKRIFHALNDGDELSTGMFCMTSGCLDALDQMPAGSMRETGRYFGPAKTVRGFTLAELQEREALAEQLIAEILAEERAESAA